jgi:two-component system KDP operon response regulator KdpE
MKSSLILVIDDEPDIRRSLIAGLTSESTRVVSAATAREGIELASAQPPDLVVLDLGLPDAQGIDVCRELRAWSSARIVVLSARHAESEKISLFEAGADDYVAKPFSLGEFVARVQAHLRRVHAGDTPAVIEFDGLEVDLQRRRVRRDGQGITLTPTEWAILRTLVTNPGRPVSHQQIFDAVWGRSYGNPQQYLRVYVTHLRRKIERTPATPRVIVTEPGVGYRFGSSED